jgi:hypothetical protein
VRTMRRPAQELRATIDRLPLEVREAVLEGIQGQRIIAGAHVDGAGGVCPMVAADVRWKRISKASVQKAQEVARAWDRYAEASGSFHPATKRQLLALRSMLEASILEETAQNEMPLSEVIAEHKLAKSRRASAPAPAAAPVAAAAPRPAAADPSIAAAAAPRSGAAAPVAPAGSRRRRDTGERDRTSELRQRDGWSWLRPYRSYDQYEEALLQALAELERHEAQMNQEPVAH